MQRNKAEPSWKNAAEWAEEEVKKFPGWLRDTLSIEEEARNVQRKSSVRSPTKEHASSRREGGTD